jgi:hypothetical protein
MGAYLEDQKELDAVCHIIQSRVQLYMTENGINDLKGN